MPQNPVTPRTDVKRRKDRATYDQRAIYAIIDEALCASVAVSIDGQPHVQPMLHARMGDDLILHGSTKNRLLTHLQGGGEVCVNITIMDGLTLGATIPDHTMNYRSVSIYGRTRLITEFAQKKAAMNKVFDSIAPARWRTLPEIDAGYLDGATQVHLLALAESVAKVNESAPAPAENEGDVWTGVLPLRWTWGPPQPKAVSGRAVPDAPEMLRSYQRPFKRKG